MFQLHSLDELLNKGHPLLSWALHQCPFALPLLELQVTHDPMTNYKVMYGVDSYPDLKE